MLNFTPRDYQIDSVNSVVRKIHEGYKRIVMQLSTGGGKTKCFTYFAHRFASKYPRSKICALVHREELYDQTTKAFFDCGLYGAEVHMVETFCNKLKKSHAAYDIIIIDECHIGNFRKIFEHYGEETIILGVSATPISASKKFPLSAEYQTIVTSIHTDELIQKGALVKAVHYAPEFEGDKKAFTKRGGSFDEKKMGAEFAKKKHVDAVLDAYNRFGGGLKTIIFNTTKEHSMKVNDLFVSKGYNSCHLDSDASKHERKQIFEWFENNDDAILNNVGIATTGYDCPSIRNVMINRCTDSLPLWLQMNGRGSRPYPGKEFFNIIDLGGNIHTQGYWHERHDWEAIFYNPGSAGSGTAPVKDCPSCFAMIFAGSTKCPYCGHFMPREVEYTSDIIKLKLIEDIKALPIKRNSDKSLDQNIQKVYKKVCKLNVDEVQLPSMLETAIRTVYEEAGRMLHRDKLYILKSAYFSQLQA